MKIISYRGPESAGGLSSALGQAWRAYACPGDLWAHIENNNLRLLSDKDKPLAQLTPEVVEGHYKYCNEFLWPLMHDLEEYAVYNSVNKAHYEQLNSMMSRVVFDTSFQTDYFVHDYHFALLPRLLRQNNRARSVIFWHIPWTRTIVNQAYIVPLMDVANGMLGAEAIGFHTQQYAKQFMQFVEQYLPQFICDHKNMSIKRARYGNWRTNNSIYSEQVIEIVVAPIGIDYDYWSSLSIQNQSLLKTPVVDLPYIFSVDRVDYTKGVTKRLQAIDCFFELYPQWQKKVKFVQVCGRTRPGIDAFDNYWNECQQLRTKIEQKWNSPDWEPLVWLQPAMSAAELAQIYRDAAVMLVNPIRDGLNLTAKEYVACQNGGKGVLALSSGAGAWHELGHYCLSVRPETPEQMAESINRALNMSDNEKRLRMSLLNDKVQINTLADWWHVMTDKLLVRAKTASERERTLVGTKP